MSPLKTFQASCDDKKQGIVAVLSSDSNSSNFQPSSLRRTLSADMSSHKWISQMKKVASSQEFGSNKKTEDETETAVVWGSIFNSCKAVADPYVHPLVKRSGRCLSDKSLEICTESLGSETGSETGSDGFSSYLSSENGDSDDDECKEGNLLGVTRMFDVEDQWRPVKYSYKKSPPRRSFPPPLPTLSGPDGESLRMQPRRDNGRLVLEALSVPSQNNFRAQRQDGRLVLTLVNQVEEVNPSEDEQEGDKERKMTKTSELSNGLLKAHRLASMMNNKSIVLANRNPSLPPRPKTAQPTTPCATPPASATAAASLNAYEYYWRSKAGAAVKPLGQQGTGFKNSSRKVVICKNRITNEEEKMVAMSSNGSCKEVRRRVVWEPRCIATS